MPSLDPPHPSNPTSHHFAPAEVAAIIGRFGQLEGSELIKAMVKEAFPGRIAAVSSFGAEAAVMLKLLADIDPAVPVIFIDTEKHFPETLAYRDTLVAHLGLCDVRTVRPDPRTLVRSDPDGKLWQRAPDACCFGRKVEPLQRQLAGFDAWFTGRKRFHGVARAALHCIEAQDGRIKVNPLAGWTSDEVTDAFETFELPKHPLVPAGYLSIGCATCTVKPSSRAQPRSGRWSDSQKTECGLHWPSRS